MKTLSAVCKLTVYALWCALGIPVQYIVLLFTRGPASLVIPLYWHRAVCRIFGLKVERHGCPVKDRQVILVSNHLSYLDIEVLSTIAPWSFVAKADVARWPLFGTLARLQQTAFTSRSRTDAMKDKNNLAFMLQSGKNLIIFPEGTSSDGRQVLPFRSSLLGAALQADSDLLVQPVTIDLIEADGRHASLQAARDLYAWHGDMTLPPHLWAFARSKGAIIRLTFHPPLKPADFTDRKHLAKHCHAVVASALSNPQIINWHSGHDAVTLPAIKENQNELFLSGSEQASSLSANKIR